MGTRQGCKWGSSSGRGTRGPASGESGEPGREMQPRPLVGSAVLSLPSVPGDRGTLTISREILSIRGGIERPQLPMVPAMRPIASRGEM